MMGLLAFLMSEFSFEQPALIGVAMTHRAFALILNGESNGVRDAFYREFVHPYVGAGVKEPS